MVARNNKRHLKDRFLSLNKIWLQIRMWGFLLLLVVFFFISLFVIFNVFQKDTFQKIEDAISNKQTTTAMALIQESINKKALSTIKLYMYGIIVEYMQDLDFEKQIYHPLLRQKDTILIYYEESFYRKFQIYPNSPLFFEEFCSYLYSFADQLTNDQYQKFIQPSIQNPTIWNIMTTNCKYLWFKSTLPMLKQHIYSTSIDNVALRDEPSLNASVINTLKKEDLVFVRFKTKEEKIENVQSSWSFILTDRLKQGYILSYYLEPNKS